MMFSLYNFIMFTLFVYFAFFLHTFALFFEDLFLIIAFILFLIIIFQLISTATTTYFAERANYIRILYAKLFTRRKEAITKNKILIKQLYLEQNNMLISQYAALFYLKHVFNVKVYKEIEIKIRQTAAQSSFIAVQQSLGRELQQLVEGQHKKQNLFAYTTGLKPRTFLIRNKMDLVKFKKMRPDTPGILRAAVANAPKKVMGEKARVKEKIKEKAPVAKVKSRNKSKKR